MSNTRTFSGVTADVVSRMKEFARAKYDIVFNPPDGSTSVATSQTPLGECVIEFTHDAAKAQLTLTLVKKPWLLPESMLWNGFTETLDQCRTQT